MMKDLLKKGLLPLYFIFLCFSTLVAQNGVNPFDLEKRPSVGSSNTIVQDTSSANPFDLEAREGITPGSESSASPASSTSETNPFDIQRTEEKKTSTPIQKEEKETDEQALSNDNTSKNTRSGFLFWSILNLTIAFALMITLYRTLFGKVYRAFTNENILKLLQREQGGIVTFPYLLWYVFFFASTGIFIFQIAYFNDTISFEFQSLLFCILGVTVFFIFKHLLLKILEFVFPIEKEIKQYSFTIVVFCIILGVILLPFNIFIAFAPSTATKGAIIAGIIAVLLVYMFRTLRGLFISSKFLAFHKFHFFMYLCTIEIAPTLILIKLLLNGADIQ